MQRSTWAQLAFCLGFLFDTLPPASAAEPSLAERLPRVAATEPKDVGRTFDIRDGFTMDPIAHEPLVMDPVAAVYGPDGRLWVVEMTDYPYTDKKNDVPFQERTTDLPIGRVRILEDSDGDGRFDRSDLLTDNLSWPTGIALYDGGAYVCATPDLWYFKDTDGDRRADVRRKVFTGFRKLNVQAVINNLVWGPDNKIYGAGSSNSGQIVTVAHPELPPVLLGRNDFRFDPRVEQFEQVSGGARFGNTFDDWGHRFVCNIRNPAQQVLLPRHYLARNPYLPVASALVDVAAAGDDVRVYRLSPAEPWRQVRAERWAAEVGAKYPRSETVAEGYFTSSSGITIYRGGAYGPEFVGNIFVGEVSANLIHRETVEPQGVTFRAQRVEPKTEFVRSRDNWFRPVNFVNAPDGTLHVLDMYRETIEHPWSIPDDIKAFLDLESGRDRGRVYRLAPPGFVVPQPPRLANANMAELIAAMESPHSWWRETAQRLLVEQRDRAAVDPLGKLLRTSQHPLARFHALWTLAGLNALADADLLVALDDEASGIRVQGILLSESRLDRSSQLLDRVLVLADDPAAEVRFQVAFSLGEAKDPRAAEVLAKLARRDAADPWMRIAVLSSATGFSEPMLTALATDPAFAGQEPGATLVRELAAVVGARHQASDIRLLVDRLAQLEGPQARVVQRSVIVGLGQGLARSRQTLEVTLAEASPPARALVRALLAEAAGKASDPAVPLAARLEAIGLLAIGPLADVRSALVALANPRQPHDIQMAAVRALAAFSDPAIASLLLAGYASYTPALRSEVVELMLTRSDRLPALLDAVEKKLVAPLDLSPVRRRMLLTHSDKRIQERSQKLLGGNETTARSAVIARYQSALSLPADALRGEVVYRRECATCHRIGTQGRDVGPNLVSVRHRTPAELITHILDPNREVAPNFVQYVVTIDDGRVTTGIIAAETATGLSLKRAEDVQETILRANIDEITSTGTSLMPEGLENKLTPQDLADLLAFILGL